MPYFRHLASAKDQAEARPSPAPPRPTAPNPAAWGIFFGMYLSCWGFLYTQKLSGTASVIMVPLPGSAQWGNCSSTWNSSTALLLPTSATQVAVTDRNPTHYLHFLKYYCGFDFPHLTTGHQVLLYTSICPHSDGGGIFKLNLHRCERQSRPKGLLEASTGARAGNGGVWTAQTWNTNQPPSTVRFQLKTKKITVQKVL